MTALRLANVTFAYPQQSSLIQDATLDFSTGWTGIVGANGTGKSTLFKLLQGALNPTVGVVHRHDLRIGSCPQALSLTDEVQEFAYAFSKTTVRLMSLLELNFDDLQRWSALSPGTQRRWQIGAALAAPTDVLLLDEPSNHLDSMGKATLIRALNQYQGIGLLISHDRSLLDAVCQTTVRLAGSVSQYPRAYTAAKQLWTAEESAQLHQLEALQDRRDALKRKMGAERSRHAQAQHKMSTRGRMNSIRDSDARSTAKKSRAAKAEAQIGRAAGVRASAYTGIERALSAFEYRPAGSQRDLQLEAAECPLTWVVRHSAPLFAGPHKLLDHAKLDLRRDDRIWLTGPNGCGKSTLLRAVMTELSEAVAERTVYVPQDTASIREVTAAALVALTPSLSQQAFNIAAALGLAPERLFDITQGEHRALSPGEWRKAAIAVGLTQQPWLVVLDEPTNDLDIQSIERLEDALAAYSGALLLVSHDAYFAEAVRAVPIELEWCTQSDVPWRTPSGSDATPTKDSQ